MAPHDAAAGERQRKADHLRIAAAAGVEHAVRTGLDEIRLRHRALPETDLASVDLTADLLGARLSAPLVVSAMTGGTASAAVINERLIRAAAACGVGLVLGSGRRLLEDRALLDTYRPRGAPRPPLLLANLGAAQIRLPGGPEHAERLVELLGADGLSVHLNPLQEAIQPEGEPSFSAVLRGLGRVVRRLRPLPVLVKEVGFGLAPEDVRALAGVGVAAVDVAGAGGTNWALVEGKRDAAAQAVATAFGTWGIPTAEALAGAVAAAPGLPLLASGGLRDGVEVAKCLALGAGACGFARPLLIAAQADHTSEALRTVIAQLRIATWLTGAPAATALGPGHLA